MEGLSKSVRQYISYDSAPPVPRVVKMIEPNHNMARSVLSLSPSQTSLSPSKLMRRLSKFSYKKFSNSVRNSLERDRRKYANKRMDPMELYLRSNPGLLLPETVDFTNAQLWRNGLSRKLMVNTFLTFQHHQSRIQEGGNDPTHQYAFSYNDKQSTDWTSNDRPVSDFMAGGSESPTSQYNSLPGKMKMTSSLKKHKDDSSTFDMETQQVISQSYLRPLTKLKEDNAKLLLNGDKPPSDLPAPGRVKKRLPERFEALKHQTNQSGDTVKIVSPRTKSMASMGIDGFPSKLNYTLKPSYDNYPIQKTISIPTGGLARDQTLVLNTKLPLSNADRRFYTTFHLSEIGESKSNSRTLTKNNRLGPLKVNPHIVNLVPPPRNHKYADSHRLPTVVEFSSEPSRAHRGIDKHQYTQDKMYNKLLLEVFSEKKRVV